MSYRLFGEGTGRGRGGGVAKGMKSWYTVVEGVKRGCVWGGGVSRLLVIYMVITHSKSKDQPGKVANPARGQLNRENEYFPVRVRA